MKKEIKPPRLADRLLIWYCQRASIEDLQGDAEELFYEDLKRMSVARASLCYWQQVLSLIFSYAVKKRKAHASYHELSSSTFNFYMIKNYFVIASRNLIKHKFFTIINVLGLAVGMSIGLLLIAMLSFLWTYDNFHENKDSIYRIVSKVDDKITNREYALAPPLLADRIKQEYSGVKEVIRISATLNGEATYENKVLPLQGYFVDSNFFTVFTFPWLIGNSNSLDKPNTMAITEKAAMKIFGAVDPVGKIVTIGDMGDFEITGLLKDHPKNSHMQFEVLASYASLEKLYQSNSLLPKSWREFKNSYVYLLLPNQQSKIGIENYLNRVSDEVYKTEKDFKASFSLQSLNDIVPGKMLYNQIGPDWEYASISVFVILTLLIVLPACFNYTNISISRALKRMKEIGLRKIMGGRQQQIFFQFIVETVLITFIALGLSYYIFTITRQEFLSMLVGGADLLSLDMTGSIVFYFIMFALMVGVVAGIVPALYFSKLSPIQALKSKPVTKNLSRFSFRKVLIVSQFAFSLGFITSVVIVLSQYRQTLNYDFGFRQANILDVPLQGIDAGIVRNEFSKLSAIQDISMSSNIVGASASESIYLKSNNQDSIEVFQMYVDDHYLTNLKLTLIAGKNFEATKANGNHVIVNEIFLQQFKLDDALSAIGQSFILPNKMEITIIGVVKDFHYNELREPIKSFFFRYNPAQFRYANLNVATTDVAKALSQMEVAWRTFGGETKFNAKFFDDEIEESYSFFFAMIKICGFLGFLAITISCLGLLGMVVFTVENRTKEVGIRKVMGASGTEVVILLSKDFAKLMIFAAIIALPLTYLFFDKVYLRTQAHKIPIGITEIIISLSVMMLLGLVTILSQTGKAARANPVDTLRFE